MTVVSLEDKRTTLPMASVVTFLVASDLVVLYGALFLAVAVRVLANPWFPIAVWFHVYAGVMVAVLLLPPAYAIARLYPGYGLTGVERLRKRVVVTALCFGSMALFDYLAQNGQWSRGILLMAGIISLVAIPTWDALARSLLIQRRWWGEAVVVLGPEPQRQRVVAALTEHPELGWIPVAEGDLAAVKEPVPGVSLVLLALPDGLMGLPTLADDLPYRRVVLVPELSGVQSLWVSVRDLGTHLGLEMRRNLLIPWNQTVKRVVDLVLGSLLLIAAIPVILFFATLLVAVSPGPVFFSQSRGGLENRPFRMWKLRTMLPNADAMLGDLIARSEGARADWNRSMKIRNDPRVIPVVGQIMRRYSIDELPQLWNVIRGDMSLVGPRPLPPYHQDRLDPSTERLRWRVRPGITGLWQVSGRSAVSLTQQQTHDIYYVRNWSLWLDIHILGRTVGVVLGGNGAW